MNRFRKGDWVKVYGHTPRLECDRHSPDALDAYRRGDMAKVINAYAKDEIYVEFQPGVGCEVHPMQCRLYQAAKKPVKGGRRGRKS